MKQKFDELERTIRECGLYAKAQQAKIRRSLKVDGSILTESDLYITRRVLDKLIKLFPGVNIVTEEIVQGQFNPQAPYTFVLDPIDGTDSYSQGFPAWCIGLGILDSRRNPVGSIVYAPRFGCGCEELFLRTDPDEDRIWLNGEVLSVHSIAIGEKDNPREVTTGSKIIHELPFAQAKCHFRSYGCSIIHIVSAVVFKGIEACLDPTCYVWDIAPAHAIAKKAGMDFQYWNGSKFFYDDDVLINRTMFKLPLVIGTSVCRGELIRRLNAH
ncbi:myo-inositol-1(or 4)-monophosphatase [Sphaerochaeta associata]|uniref:Inositol monophosphatase n=1 Tax=Sphaerochaeta associata TaxID=1129264 RepID=A0ABY4DA84_9SPIR|nr:inositol monophosphatase family protein [Sphaerochaeta associata]UOM51095.1 inositol monophosphatase [Sphaerochaeta associata]SMP56471.1 myo-inositol-1(or 4)-monophosphatase [Sphaerochaeta associata]